MDGLDLFVSTDFVHRCRTRRFCFQCEAPFFPHCCAAPADHRRLHHGGLGPAPAELNLVCGTPCIRSDDFNGSGYSTAKVQRFTKFHRQWIPVLPQPNEDFRLKRNCLNCNRRLKSGMNYCSVLCRRLHINNPAHSMPLELVEFAHHYNQPVVRLNRFCRMCSHAYSAQSCADHMLHHEQDPVAAAAMVAAGAIITVEEFDGLPVVEDHELPADYVDQVQAIHLQDGRIFFPIHARSIEQLAHLPEDPEAHPCGVPQCPEVIRGPAQFCSLRCRHQA